MTTVEGLRSQSGLHAVQHAFIDSGAVQCGFCTPGLIVATAALLERVPNPSDDVIREELSGISVAVPATQDLRRRSACRPRMTTTEQQQAELQRARVGDRGTRHDATPKVTGEFQYSSDLHAAGMLWGVTVRSPHAHAKIVELDISAALRMAGVHAVLTHADVPGQKTYGLEFADQPVLAADRVRYYGEPVALVAAEEPEQARRAAAAVRVDTSCSRR